MVDFSGVVRGQSVILNDVISSSSLSMVSALVWRRDNVSEKWFSAPFLCLISKPIQPTAIVNESVLTKDPLFSSASEGQSGV